MAPVKRRQRCRSALERSPPFAFPMVPPTSSPCVRECLRGVWSRTLFTTSDGHRDETSVVLWLQTDTLFGDLRIPASCHQPAAGVTPRAEDWDECISFAGHAVLDDADVCHWYQHVNRGVAFLPGGDPPPLLPQGQSADVARLKWISADTMHEVRVRGRAAAKWTSPVKLPFASNRTTPTGCTTKSGSVFRSQLATYGPSA
jgi:hypothetical protein